MDIAGPSYALFALVWAAVCVLSGVLVTGAMLGDLSSPSARPDPSGETAPAEP